MLNKVMLIGKVIEQLVGQTPTGSDVDTHFTLATGTTRTLGPGAEEVEFFDIAASPPLAERYAREIRRGSLVFVEGRVVAGEEEGGSAPHAIRVVASDLEVVGEPQQRPRSLPPLPADGGMRHPFSQQQARAPGPAFTQPTHVFILAPTTTDMLLTILGQMQAHRVHFVALPRLPMWVEFEPPPKREANALPFQAMCALPIGERETRCLLFPAAERLRELRVSPEGAWRLEKGEPCGNRSCPFTPWRQAYTRYRMSQARAAQFFRTCSCAASALAQVQWLFLVGHVLATEGIGREALPQKPRLAGLWGNQLQAALWDLVPEQYERLSLSKHTPKREKDVALPVPGSGDRVWDPVGSGGSSKREISPYHRWLIPGVVGGRKKPWRRFQIIYCSGTKDEDLHR